MRGVDEEGLTCIQDMSNVFAKMANWVEKNKSADRAVEAFIRGAKGDPFGVAKEVIGEQRAITEEVQRVDILLRQTRARLTSRYEIEFPNWQSQ